MAKLPAVRISAARMSISAPAVITAAIIFAEAAVAEGKEAVQSHSYGPEARGGASKSEVIIDDKPIFHPHVIVPDLVLAMTQKAADKY